VVIHIGLAFDRSYFAIEKGAPRDGYHAIPDEDRKVFTKAENKKLWGKSPERLDPGFNFEKALEGWKKAVSGGVKGKGKGKGKGREEDLRVSDDVGVYICGFVYYLSLERLRESKKRSLVVFLHVPPLEGREEVERGVQIVIGLVKALVEQKEK
jgi:pyroglutamyl-peptidase